MNDSSAAEPRILQTHGTVTQVLQGMVAAFAVLVLLEVHPVWPQTAGGTGVSLGDRVSWSVTSALTAREEEWRPSGPTAYQVGVEEVRARVRWVSDQVRLDLTAASRDGSARTVVPVWDPGNGNLSGGISEFSLQGIPGLFIYLGPANSEPGEEFYLWWKGATRTLSTGEVLVRRYAGASREVYMASLNISEGDGRGTLTGIWDRGTGILCEADLLWTAPEYRTNVEMRILETTRWGVVRSTNWRILFAGAVMLVAAFYFLARARKRQV